MNFMYCKKCGNEIPSGSKFCPNCGAKQLEKVSSSNVSILGFVKRHEILLLIYLAWFIWHFILYRSADNIIGGDTFDVFDNGVDISYGFYPYNNSIANILAGKGYYLSFFDNVNVYDESEFVFYTVLLPILLFIIFKCFSGIKKYKQSKNFVFMNKKQSQKNIKESHESLKENSEEKETSNDDLEAADLVKTDIINGDCELENTKEQDNDIDSQSQDDSNQDGLVCEDAKNTVKKLPLLSRFLGSLIDKVILLVLFVIVSFAVKPWGATIELGTYIGIRNTAPDIYEYLDKGAMEKYETDTRPAYRLAVSEAKPPYMGYTLDLDKKITFSFILLNMLYYILLESIISASLGKKMLGGVLCDVFDDKIGYGKALVRGFWLGVLMAGLYYILHLLGGLTNTTVVVVFFLLLDIPVLFTKRSLLDICTGTTYLKKNKK